MSQCPLGGHYISNTNIIPLSSRVCPWSGILRHINLKSLTFPPDLVKTEPSPTSQIRGIQLQHGSELWPWHVKIQ